MIDGLKLTMTGEELRKRLDERVKDHERRVKWYKAEAKRGPNPKDEFDFVLPEHMCEYEQEFHGWRAKVLAYIREHLEGGEVYRLGSADLEFGEILPEQPGLVAQQEIEPEERVAFSLERIAKEVGRSSFRSAAIAEAVVERLDDRERKTGHRGRRRASKAVAAK
jgi:hypothetical protein